MRQHALMRLGMSVKAIAKCSLNVSYSIFPSTTATKDLKQIEKKVSSSAGYEEDFVICLNVITKLWRRGLVSTESLRRHPSPSEKTRVHKLEMQLTTSWYPVTNRRGRQSTRFHTRSNVRNTTQLVLKKTSTCVQLRKTTLTTKLNKIISLLSKYRVSRMFSLSRF